MNCLMTNINGKAIAAFSIKTNSDNEDDIADFANSLSLLRFGEGMDCLDLGDSMGVFMRVAWDDFYSGELVNLYFGANGIQVEINLDFENFQWEGLSR